MSYAYFSYLPPSDESIDKINISFVRENSEQVKLNSKNGI